MADQQPKRRVTAQIPLSGQSTPGGSSVPRARAKVDVGSIATPPARPALGNSPSSSSLSIRAGQANIWTPGSSSTPVRSASPVTSRPSYPPTQPEARVTPVIRARATTAIGRSATTPAGPSSSPAQYVAGRDRGSPAPCRPLSRASSTVGGLGVNVNDRRAKVKLPDSAPSPRAPHRPAMSSPLLPQTATTFIASPMSTHSELSRSPAEGPTYTSGYDLEPTTSVHSLPDTSAIPSHLYYSPLNPQHPNASCPPSPPTGGGLSKRRGLPPHPSLVPMATYDPPSSPQLHVIALPNETPRRNSDASMGSPESVPGSSRVMFSQEEMGLLLPDPREFAGSAQMQDEGSSPPPGDDSLDTIGDDAEEAKINRKIADLEISNASLMAINKMLETTKAKQRTEILKLRRALRESRDGLALGLGMNRALLSPLPATTPGVDEIDDPLVEGEEGFDEMVDPEMEERWEKIQELVSNMQRRAQTAVDKGLETGRIAAQRVLDWTEVEETPVETPRGAGD